MIFFINSFSGNTSKYIAKNIKNKLGFHFSIQIFRFLQHFNLETAVGRAGVCDFCELSPGGEMPAYPTWGVVQGATRAWLLPL